jgi:isocitrate dehydrogenase
MVQKMKFVLFSCMDENEVKEEKQENTEKEETPEKQEKKEEEQDLDAILKAQSDIYNSTAVLLDFDSAEPYNEEKEEEEVNLENLRFPTELGVVVRTCSLKISRNSQLVKF